MSDPSSQTPGATQELTPEARAILARARRSFMVTMGLLLLGFIAIGVALVYRATRDEAPAGAAYAAEALRVPQGAEVISATAADGNVTVTYRLGPALQVRVFAGASGELLSQFDVVTE